MVSFRNIKPKGPPQAAFLHWNGLNQVVKLDTHVVEAVLIKINFCEMNEIDNLLLLPDLVVDSLGDH